jgi:hypothetical protein
VPTVRISPASASKPAGASPTVWHRLTTRPPPGSIQRRSPQPRRERSATRLVSRPMSGRRESSTPTSRVEEHSGRRQSQRRSSWR